MINYASQLCACPKQPFNHFILSLASKDIFLVLDKRIILISIIMDAETSRWQFSKMTVQY